MSNRLVMVWDSRCPACCWCKSDWYGSTGGTVLGYRSMLAVQLTTDTDNLASAPAAAAAVAEAAVIGNHWWVLWENARRPAGRSVPIELAGRWSLIVCTRGWPRRWMMYVPIYQTAVHPTFTLLHYSPVQTSGASKPQTVERVSACGTMARVETSV